MSQWKDILDKLRDEHETLVEMADSGIISAKEIQEFNRKVMQYQSNSRKLGKKAQIVSTILEGLRAYWTERILDETGVFLIMYQNKR